MQQTMLTFPQTVYDANLFHMPHLNIPPRYTVVYTEQNSHHSSWWPI